MPYKIVITKTETVRKMTRGEHTIVGDKEVPREGCFTGSREDEPTTRIAHLYGYAPDREMDVEKTSEIFSQSVDDIKLQDVIKAINGIS